MSIVSKICITKKSGDVMQEVETIKLVANKGIIKDRYFNDNNDKDLQVTLIESENIDYFNKILQTNFSYIDFRRNIVTSGVRLNNLIGKEIQIGDVKLKGHRLCDPCKYLQDKLKQKNLVANLINKGGLRCEILMDGTISVYNKIVILK